MLGRNSRRIGYVGFVGMGLVLPFLVRSAMAQEKKDAGKSQSSPAAIAQYADAANAQNGGAYKLAVDQWEEFLKKFPKDPLAAKAQHYLGVCQMQLKKFDAAAKAFDAVIKSYPTFDLLEDAYLNLAWCQFSQASPEKPELYAPALGSFAALLTKYPKGKYVDQGRFFEGIR